MQTLFRGSYELKCILSVLTNPVLQGKQPYIFPLSSRDSPDLISHRSFSEDNKCFLMYGLLQSIQMSKDTSKFDKTRSKMFSRALSLVLRSHWFGSGGFPTLHAPRVLEMDVIRRRAKISSLSRQKDFRDQLLSRELSSL